MKKNLHIFLFFFIFAFLLSLFFYKLSDTPLLSYDEAWYATITRNMVTTQNPLRLIFNDKIFTDHPPFGYMLMSIPTILFGSNEFSARFISALVGALSIIFIYKIGKKLGTTTTGIVSSSVLLSSMWFMFRARSGNLDVPLVFFGILTVYLLQQKHKKFFYLGIISFALELLIKTLVGVGILPIVLYLCYINHRNHSKKDYLIVVAIFFSIILPWFVYNQYLDTNFLHHHFFDIGIRGQENGYSITAIQNSLNYLAIGIGKWYKVFLVSAVGLLIVFFKEKKLRQQILTLFFWFSGFSLFLISSKTEIWHLLPIYPVVALSIALLPKVFEQFLNKKLNKIVETTFLVFTISLTLFQYNQFSNLLYTNQNGYSNEKDISIKAGKYENIYLLDTFMPASIYYSQKHVTSLHWDTDSYKSLTDLLESETRNVFIVNTDIVKKLKAQAISFKILEKNDSYLLISN